MLFSSQINDIYEEIVDEGPPPIPLCYVDETATLARRRDERVEEEPPRSKSHEDLNTTTDTKTHGYLNVMQGDELHGKVSETKNISLQ